jgi:hypothetical protein
MKEQLISFETANLAKEKKFDWLTRYYFNQITAGPFETHENSLDDYNSSHWNEENGEWISRPTQSLLQKWLRDIHNIHVEILYEYKKENSSYDLNVEFEGISKYYKSLYNTYEEALEIGLQEGLKLIKL